MNCCPTSAANKTAAASEIAVDAAIKRKGFARMFAQSNSSTAEIDIKLFLSRHDSRGLSSSSESESDEANHVPTGCSGISRVRLLGKRDNVVKRLMHSTILRAARKAIGWPIEFDNHLLHITASPATRIKRFACRFGRLASGGGELITATSLFSPRIG